MLVTLTLVSTHISLFRTDGVRTSQQCVCIYTGVYSQTLTAISIFKYVNIVCIIQVHRSNLTPPWLIRTRSPTTAAEDSVHTGRGTVASIRQRRAPGKATAPRAHRDRRAVARVTLVERRGRVLFFAASTTRPTSAVHSHGTSLDARPPADVRLLLRASAARTAGRRAAQPHVGGHIVLVYGLDSDEMSNHEQPAQATCDKTPSTSELF